MKVTANPALAVVLSASFAVVSAAGGLVLSLGPGLPVSPFVTSISFGIYLACRGIAAVRGRRVSRDASRDNPENPDGDAPGDGAGSTEGVTAVPGDGDHHRH